jgi:exosome complex component RRP43
MTTATAPPHPTSLSFSCQTFAKLSPHPFLLAHLKPSTQTESEIRRPNSRLPTEFRKPHINAGSLTHAEGSAVVRLGDTTAVCGVRAEILLASNIPNPSSLHGIEEDTEAEKELKELDLLVPNIELATGCSPAFLPGQPPSTLAQSLSTRLYSLLHASGVVDGRRLRIWWSPPVPNNGGEKEGMDVDDDNEVGEEDAKPVIKAFWTLYIDILFISLDGNPFDAAWASCLAALQNVRLPFAYWDADNEMVLCSDDIEQSKKLTLRGLPTACTFAIFRAKDAAHHHLEGQGSKGPGDKDKNQWILADPDTFEEGLCDESVTVVVDCSGEGSERRMQGRERTKIVSISKSGGTGIGREEMRELVTMAERRWGEWEGVLRSTLSGTEGKS